MRSKEVISNVTPRVFFLFKKVFIKIISYLEHGMFICDVGDRG
jgi:hypothetical protein